MSIQDRHRLDQAAAALCSAAGGDEDRVTVPVTFHRDVYVRQLAAASSAGRLPDTVVSDVATEWLSGDPTESLTTRKRC